MHNAGHTPVLLDEILDLLDPQLGQTYVDLTMGRGGHAEAIPRRLGPHGSVIGFDLDQNNLDFCRQRLAALGEHAPQITLFQGSFDDAPRRLRDKGITADLLLADLGFSSNQMDDGERGFSFSREGPLDMRLDVSQSVTAAMIVNESSEEELARLMWRYGEEPLAKKIAATIAENRSESPILTTTGLARLVRSAYGARARSSRMDPATKTFQALRIAVNDELGRLEALWESIADAAKAISPLGGDAGIEHQSDGGWMARGARLAFVSFHSLEDRIIKRAMAELDRQGLARRLTRKPIKASPAEVESNPRSRSAKLRVAQLGV